MVERVDVPVSGGGSSASVTEVEANALRREVERLRAAAAHQENRIACIQEIGVAMGSTLELDDLLHIIMEKITVLMEADRSTLFLMDDDGRYLWSKVIQGSQINEIRLKVGEGIAGWVGQSGKSVNIRDAYRDPRFNAEIDLKTGYQTRSILCQPIRNQNRKIIGVIQVLNRRTGHFTVEDENLLSALAAQAAISLENSKLYRSMWANNLELMETQEKLKKKIGEIDFLFDLQKEISRAVELPEIVEAVASRALGMIRAQICAVTIRESNHLRVFYVRLSRESLVEVVELPLLGLLRPGSDPNAACIYKVEPGSPLEHALGTKLGLDTRDVLSVPLMLEDRNLGALEMINRMGPPVMEEGANGESEVRHPSFSPDDLKLLSLMAGQIATPVAASIDREEKEKEARLQTIGQMLSGVIHDFKTPVTIISGYVQLMAQQDSGEIRQEYAQSVIKQFDQLNKMTRELLAFARGETSILLRKVFLHKLTDELRELLGRDLGERGVHVTIHNRYGGAAKLDEVKIKRAIFNLARNAAEAMPGGGSFTVDVYLDGAEVVFDLSDTGPGIPPEIRGSLFESFVTRGKEQGTGLGLAIVKKIVEDHNGSISYETETGKGTVFTIRIPVEQD